MSDVKTQLNKQIQAAIKRLEQVQQLYDLVITDTEEMPGICISLNDKPYFNKLIEHFGACLNQESANIDLKTIFDIAFHKKTGSIIIANKGTTLFCRSPQTHTPYIIRHIGACIYRPALGIEFANIGLSGNIYDGKVIVRSESACAPSFIFGTERCNCCYQWASIKEIAAYLNPTQVPSLEGEELEEWVIEQFKYKNGRHIPINSNSPGVVMMHFDTQGGMGGGFTEGEFVFDLYTRAIMRHLAENTVEQVYKTSLKAGYESLGIEADARKEKGCVGYAITSILLDWLDASKDIVLLSNNKFKISTLEENGYQVSRIKTLGKIDMAGSREAEYRGKEFGHLDIGDGARTSFEEEMVRLKKELVLV